MDGGRAFTRLACGIAGVEPVVADTTMRFGRHSHDQYGLGWMERGGHRSASGRGMVEAMPGDLITVNPGELHDGAPIRPDGRRWRMLYLEPSILRDALADGAGVRSWGGEFADPVLRSALAVRRIRSLFLAATRPRPDALEWDQALLELLGSLLRCEPGDPRDVPMSIRLARSRLDDDPSADLRLDDLATQAGLSRFQFLRAFAKLTGATPHAYRMQRRLQLARRRLLGGERPADVAAACGFSDQSHLTRLFVRAFGFTPAAYARAGH